MPSIKLDFCTKCLKCVKDCPSDSIDINRGTISNSCIHCGHCVAICPESTIIPDTEEIIKLQPHTVSPAVFQQLSANIRSCRSFQNKAVDKETLEMLVENMKHYPSASNARPAQVTIIKSEELIKKLNDQTANKFIRTLKLITAPILKPIIQLMVPKSEMVGLKRYKEQFIAKQTEGSSQVCHHAPIVMLFHAPKTKFGMADSDSYIWASYTSIYANTLGLGTCFIGFIVKAMERSKEMRKEFGIPKNHVVHASLIAGYPKVKYTNEVGRDLPKMKII